MGSSEFLTGEGVAASNLPEALDQIEEASTLFLHRWREGNQHRAGEISTRAIILLDYVVAELLREQVGRKTTMTWSGSALATAFDIECGRGLAGTSAADQIAMMKRGAGQGRLPAHLGPAKPISLMRLLNKIKHRHPGIMNFRDEGGRHILVIATEHTSGGAEGIYEFDVVDFCAACRSAAEALRPTVG